MKKFALTLAVAMLLLAIVALPGCNKTRKIPKELEIPANFDYGKWTDSTYRNDFFGFSITKPKEWAIAGEDVLKAIDQDGAEFANSLRDDKKIVSEQDKKMLELVETITANLFAISRYSDEEYEEYADEEVSNPNIILKVQKNSIPGHGDVLKQTEFVKALRQGLSEIPGCVIKSQTNKMIGGQEFTSVQTQTTIMDFGFSQEMLVCLRNGYAMLFCLTFLDDSEKKLLDDIMATLKWD